MNSTLLAKEDFQVIEDYVKDNLANWLSDTSIGHPPVVYEIELTERIIRVDEEPKRAMPATWGDENKHKMIKKGHKNVPAFNPLRLCGVK
jgi:hypothetical protein